MTDNTIQIRSLCIGDIPEAMKLVHAEGWNQTENDWQLLINDPQNVCFAAEVENILVGTATAINYNNEVAWIGMVLVSKEYRGRGISKVLLFSLIDRLKSCKSIKLDATPAGKIVYEKIGFKDEYVIHRMVKPADISELSFTEENISIGSLQDKRINEVVQLDQEAFGVRRESFIRTLAGNSLELSVVIEKNGKLTGFALGRVGSRFTQIGPVSAQSEEEAKALICFLLKLNYRSPLVIDVLDSQQGLIKWLELTGFSIQRPFTRMYLGENPFPGSQETQFSISGPEFG